jgi:hypothetical protein
MNFTESFDQFSSRVTTLDLALYAGVGLVLWVLFKDKLSPVQKALGSLLSNLKSINSQPTNAAPAIVSVPVTNNPVVPTDEFNIPRFTVVDDVFFRLVVSWKQTRDLAEESGCQEAVKAADQMFPFLSPNICGKETK